MQLNWKNLLIVFLILFLIKSTVISKYIFRISKYFSCMKFRKISIFLYSWIISFFAFNNIAIFNDCCSCFFISTFYFFVWSLKIYSGPLSSVLKNELNKNSKSEISNDSKKSAVGRRRLYFENDWKKWTLNWSEKKIDEIAIWDFETLFMINIVCKRNSNTDNFKCDLLIFEIFIWWNISRL